LLFQFGLEQSFGHAAFALASLVLVQALVPRRLLRGLLLAVFTHARLDWRDVHSLSLGRLRWETLVAGLSLATLRLVDHISVGAPAGLRMGFELFVHFAGTAFVLDVSLLDLCVRLCLDLPAPEFLRVLHGIRVLQGFALFDVCEGVRDELIYVVVVEVERILSADIAEPVCVGLDVAASFLTAHLLVNLHKLHNRLLLAICFLHVRERLV